MKYLVLGSEGQIGTELCKFLKKEGHEVLEFDIAKNPLQDLRLPNIIDELVQKSDFVMFLAFDVGGSRYLKKYQYSYDFIENNTKLTLYTFESLKKYNKPFIFTSSQMANMSYSPYGICKSLGEVFSQSLNGLVVKFWNVYGYEHDLEKSHVITDFIFKAKQGKIEMMTDGNEVRQFLHAEDCSRCLMILSQEYNKIDRTQNLHVTNFQWNSIIDVAKIIKNIIPCDIVPSKEIDTIQLNKRNEPDKYVLNFWKPEITLEVGIKKIIEEINKNVF